MIFQKFHGHGHGAAKLGPGMPRAKLRSMSSNREVHVLDHLQKEIDLIVHLYAGIVSNF